MNRSALAILGKLHPVAEGNEHVLLAGHEDPVATVAVELPLQELGEGAREILLIDAGQGRGAGIDAAMARIDDDHRAGIPDILDHGPARAELWAGPRSRPRRVGNAPGPPGTAR